jgi:glycosyltransferase involved in cell wall biosynthesis
MRILCVHNQFRKFAGSDTVAAADAQLLERHAAVTTYTRNSNEVTEASGFAKLQVAVDTLYSQRTVREITGVVENFRPDIAYVHNVFPLISPSLYHVLHRLRIPSVHILHDFRLWCANSRFYVNDQVCELCKLGNNLAAIRKRCVQQNMAYSTLYATSLYANRKMGLLDNIGGYICLTDFAKNVLIQAEIPENKIHVCPNHIDTSLFTPKCGSGKYALYLGGLYRDKGVLTVVKAFAQLPHIPLRVVGTGDAEKEVRDYIATHRLTNIELLGFQSGREKQESLANSLFTIVASHCYENFPLVVLEAFSSGKPVIASSIGALPYIVEHEKTGLLFEPQNSDDLADKVRWLYDRQGEIDSMGRQARATVEQKYDIGLRYTALSRIFEKVIEGARWN